MDRRLIFPVAMFITAGASFAFGIWQYVGARQIARAADQRMAFIADTIQHSSASSTDKQKIFASIFRGLPEAPSKFGIDFSGSFASQTPTDTCINQGQRAVCAALIQTETDAVTRGAICGSCNPE